VPVIRFEGDLRELLRVSHHSGAVTLPPGRRASVKDMIEACGVPHTEVGEVFSDETPVDFSHIPDDAANIRVSPPDVPLDVTRPSRLRPQAYAHVSFVVDVNVGKLASLLRVLGVDTCYRSDFGDEDIAAVAERESRIVLTKDIALLKRKRIRYGRLVRARLPDRQLAEVVRFFGLTESVALFSRCLRCNTLLEPVAKAAIMHRLELKTKQYFHRFNRCPDCDRIYWRGSHHDDLIARLRSAGIPVSGGVSGRLTEA
jgi:hypothetical protein